jgi:hypothetical protein
MVIFLLFLYNYAWKTGEEQWVVVMSTLFAAGTAGLGLMPMNHPSALIWTQPKSAPFA